MVDFPVHEFRMFLAAFLRWALDYPPRATSVEIVPDEERQM